MEKFPLILPPAMIDFKRYAFYDRDRTMRLTLEPMSREALLAAIPGEIVAASALLAARLGLERAPDELLRARAAEFAALDEETGFRLWINAPADREGRTVYVSAPDAMPDVGDAPDWCIASGGFLIGSAEEILAWAGSHAGLETVEECRDELCRILSGVTEAPHAAVLRETATDREIMSWPVRCGNPIRALSAAAAQWPEVCYAEDDFDFALKPDLTDRPEGARAPETPEPEAD